MPYVPEFGVCASSDVHARRRRTNAGAHSIANAQSNSVTNSITNSVADTESYCKLWHHGILSFRISIRPRREGLQIRHGPLLPRWSWWC